MLATEKDYILPKISFFFAILSDNWDNNKQKIVTDTQWHEQ